MEKGVIDKILGQRLARGGRMGGDINAILFRHAQAIGHFTVMAYHPFNVRDFYCVIKELKTFNSHLKNPFLKSFSIKFSLAVKVLEQLWQR
jgi:hypothetical protein